MNLRIDKTWPLTAAEQLKAQLRLAIRTGRIRTGHALPTVRTLAGNLALNPNTIAAVYRDLENEGLVTKHRRGGTRVAPTPMPAPPADREFEMAADRLIRLARSQHRTGAELLRLLAARWTAIDADTFGDRDRYPLYTFLQRYDHDQS